MRRAPAWLLLLGAAAHPGAAHPGAAQAQVADAGPAVLDCRAASDLAEQEAGLPPGLLFAIGKIETGRPNRLTGVVEPWPWATNQGSVGHYFASAEEAIAWTAATEAAGLRSIDVGCFQINLMYHPEAFATLEQAFDPLANALYAARFLVGLYRRSGSWQLATAQYHSADPALGGPYGDRVYSAWSSGDTIGLGWKTPGPGGIEEGRLGLTLPFGVGDRRTGGAAATLPGRGRFGDPVVVRLSARALGVRVILPAWATAEAAAPPATPRQASVGSPALPPAQPAQARHGRDVSPDLVSVQLPRGGRLPRVYHPSAATPP